MDSALQLIQSNTEVVSFFLWPLITALVNLVLGNVEPKWPRFAAMMRATGTDLRGVARAVLAKK